MPSLLLDHLQTLLIFNRTSRPTVVNQFCDTATPLTANFSFTWLKSLQSVYSSPTTTPLQCIIGVLFILAKVVHKSQHVYARSPIRNIKTMCDYHDLGGNGTQVITHYFIAMEGSSYWQHTCTYLYKYATCTLTHTQLIAPVSYTHLTLPTNREV